MVWLWFSGLFVGFAIGVQVGMMLCRRSSAKIGEQP